MEVLRQLTPPLLLLLTAVSRSSQDKLPAGGCLEGGVLVSEGSLVPQEDPCHVCHCHRGQIQCFWKSCASPPQLCEVMQLENRCNPSLYVCPIPASVAEAPIRSASSLLVEASQPAPETPPSRAAATTRGRGRSRSRVRSSRVRSSRLSSSRLRSPNSAAAAPASVTAAKRARLSSRRRRPTVKPAATEQTVTRTQVRTPQTVTQTEVRSPQTVTRSSVRSPRPSRRRVRPRPGMKIRLGPPVLPLVQPVDGFLPPPTDSSVIADSAVAASVLSGSTYFNEELSVPQNFTMPQGRGASATRPPQQLLSDERRNKPFRFGPSRPKTASEQDTEVSKAAEAQLVTEPPQTTTTATTTTAATTTAATTTAATTTAAATEAPRPAGRGRDFRRTSRRRGSSRRRTPSRSPAPSRVSSRRVVSPPRNVSARRSRLAARRAQAAQRAAAARGASSASSTTSAPVTTAAPAAPVTTAAPTTPRATAASAAPPTRTSSRRFRSRSRGKPRHETVPVMTFDYDLEEDINPTDFMFPEFGRRLRRSLLEEEVFDVEAVRRLEEEWSARQHRRRRSLLPGDENRVHGATAVKSCSILGVKYELGEVIGVASDNCLECRCAAQAMFCSPKCCFFSLEERVLRQGRQRTPDQDPPRPHPLHVYIKQ